MGDWGEVDKEDAAANERAAEAWGEVAVELHGRGGRGEGEALGNNRKLARADHRAHAGRVLRKSCIKRPSCGK